MSATTPPTVKPFAMAIPDSSLSLLAAKLAAATLPPESDFADDWESGAPLRDVRRLAARWRDGFDWRAHEARLNRALPQFTTRVALDGGFGELEIHLVHQRSSREGGIPLLFCHGCESFVAATFPVVKLRRRMRAGGAR